MPDIPVLELAAKSPEEINQEIHKTKSERIAELTDEVAQYRAEALGWHNAAAKWENRYNDLNLEINYLREQVKSLSIENVRLMNSKHTNIFNLRQYPA